MKIWWHSNQRRLKAEKDAIAELEASSDWLRNVEWSLDDRFRLKAVFDICLEHRNFHLRITYHDTHPSSSPSVAPVEDIRISSHQYGQGGDLCLQIRPDNWNPDDYTGADMIQSTYELLAEETPDDNGVVTIAPSDHNVPSVIEMRREVFRLYLSAATQQILALGALDRSKVKLGFNYHRGSHFHMIALIHGLEKGDFSWLPPDVPGALGADVYLHDGILIHTPLLGVALSQISNEDDLVTALDDDLIPSSGDYYRLTVSSDGKVVLFCKHHGIFFRCTTIQQPQEANCRSGDISKKLSAQRVGIVGLGSLGSKIAVSLARAGVGSFVLVDGDILHVGNLERHDADWRDIGVHKVDIIARRVQFLAPQVHCDPRRTMIGAQVSSEEAGNVSAALGNCNLIIDATAEVDVFNHLAGLVMMSDATLVWGAVFAGGVGSETGRSRPRKDPSPFHIRNAIGQVYDSADDVAPLAEKGQNYGGNNDDVTIVATDAEVSATASLMTSLSLDALIDREPSRYHAHAYLVGYARGWIFENPFHVQPVISGAPLRSDESQSDEEFLEKEFLENLIREKAREIENSPQSS